MLGMNDEIQELRAEREAASERVKELENLRTPKMFPLQANLRKDAAPGPLSIPWSIAEKAYGVYASRNGRSQSLERLAERGGFGVSEMDDLYPPWRQEVDRINILEIDLALRQQQYYDAVDLLKEFNQYDSDDDLWSAMKQERDKARNELAAVKSFVSSLPQTANGFPIAIGLKVACPRGHIHEMRPSDSLGGGVYCCVGECWSEGCQSDSGGGTRYQLDQCKAVHPLYTTDR